MHAGSTKAFDVKTVVCLWDRSWSEQTATTIGNVVDVVCDLYRCLADNNCM